MQWTDRIGRRLKPRDLHVFLTVAEQGNMAKAAERLAISRPVISKTIADLEQTLAVKLLDRTPRGVEPTIYGRALLKRTVAVFDELRESVKEIEFLSDPNAGELRIGCTEVMASGFVSAVIEKMLGKHPNLVFRMELGSAPTLQFQLLPERKCELVIARQLNPGDQSELDAEVLFYEKLVVAAGPRNKWQSGRRVTLADLADERWILTRLETEPGSPVFEAFQACGLPVPRARILSESVNLRNCLLAAGRFVTIIPESILRFGPERRLFQVLPIRIPRWRLPIAIMTLKNRTLSPAAQRFITMARELAKPVRA